MRAHGVVIDAPGLEHGAHLRQRRKQRSVEGDAHRGEDKTPYPTSCSSIIHQPSLVALAANFFDSIDPNFTVAMMHQLRHSNTRHGHQPTNKITPATAN